MSVACCSHVLLTARPVCGSQNCCDARSSTQHQCIHCIHWHPPQHGSGVLSASGPASREPRHRAAGRGTHSPAFARSLTPAGRMTHWRPMRANWCVASLAAQRPSHCRHAPPAFPTLAHSPCSAVVSCTQRSTAPKLQSSPRPPPPPPSPRRRAHHARSPRARVSASSTANVERPRAPQVASARLRTLAVVGRA